MDIGIDRLGFYVPQKYIDLVELANERDVDPNKFTIGIGQSKQAVPDLYQDAVTMALESADQVVNEDNREDIGLVIVGTESSVDESKASATYLVDLLDLPEDVRAFEIKEACYGATAGLQMAYNFVAMNPDKKALVVASDIARYGINTPGEVTQGAGSVAMLISKDPHILKLDNKSVYMTRNVGDFWRPVFSKTAFARGKYSNEVYVDFFKTLWEKFQTKYDMTVQDFDTMLFHIPYTKMGLKALRTLDGNIPDAKYKELEEHYQSSIEISRNVGNLYTGSLYLGLISYLINGDVKPNEHLMLFSYGSGAVGEIYSAEIKSDYKKYLDIEYIKKELNDRKKISISDYEDIFEKEVENGDVTAISDVHDKFYLSEIKENERLYKKLE
ncbi:hydroxymethylglutaryl-CoA synthase [Companilactobacillus allii]|uniref:Hydroxymethylglutaryl-CoA synthase n=1 Tax=Companilactobacillus allii TaxID=1847728 RepID=A0A1P8Q2T2_9LACO|nr:hydroxymethylglutaryl-CoA synthase [Companilactobacillus allii]APX72168.1 hydroxymethylglutaryl-CoA synthase [Companilactobacillus allii]USQ69265.1 hydroxymethylglutaryl-CoA synthase [Companilactobacillus allii]